MQPVNLSLSKSIRFCQMSSHCQSSISNHYLFISNFYHLICYMVHHQQKYALSPHRHFLFFLQFANQREVMLVPDYQLNDLNQYLPQHHLMLSILLDVIFHTDLSPILLHQNHPLEFLYFQTLYLMLH